MNVLGKFFVFVRPILAFWIFWQKFEIIGFCWLPNFAKQIESNRIANENEQRKQKSRMNKTIKQPISPGHRWKKQLKKSTKISFYMLLHHFAFTLMVFQEEEENLTHKENAKRIIFDLLFLTEQSNIRKKKKKINTDCWGKMFECTFGWKGEIKSFFDKDTS